MACLRFASGGCGVLGHVQREVQALRMGRVGFQIIPQLGRTQPGFLAQVLDQGWIEGSLGGQHPVDALERVFVDARFTGFE